MGRIVLADSVMVAVERLKQALEVALGQRVEFVKMTLRPKRVRLVSDGSGDVMVFGLSHNEQRVTKISGTVAVYRSGSPAYHKVEAIIILEKSPCSERWNTAETRAEHNTIQVGDSKKQVFWTRRKGSGDTLPIIQIKDAGESYWWYGENHNSRREVASSKIFA